MGQIAMTVKEAVKETGLSRSRLYEVFNSGAIKPRKAGKTTLVLRTELEAYVKSLPLAYK